MTTITFEVPDVIEYAPKPGRKTKAGFTYRVNTTAWAKPEVSARSIFDLGVSTALSNCAALSEEQIATLTKNDADFDLVEYVHTRRLAKLESWTTGESATRERLTPEERMRREVAVEMLRASAKAKGKKLPPESDAAFTALREAVYTKYSAKIDAEVTKRLEADLVVELDDSMFEAA